MITEEAQWNKMQAMKWWSQIDGATVDPLTLESICDFQVEPFQIGKTLFDGEVLAH